MALNNGLNSPLPLSPTKGGTGVSNPSAGALLLGNGVSALQQLALLDGQLPIGRTGLSPLPSYLSAGAGISISNGPGSITISSAPENYFVGFTHTYPSNTSMTFGPGLCTASNNGVVMQNVTNFTKITSAWTQGSGGGGFPASVPVAANQSYATFAISTASNVVDFGFDSSLTATNLLTSASGAGFVNYRRIGFVRTNGSAQIYTMKNSGNYFIYLIPIVDYYANPESGTTTTIFNTNTPAQLSIPGLFFCAANAQTGTNGHAKLFPANASVPAISYPFDPLSFSGQSFDTSLHGFGSSAYTINTINGQVGITMQFGAYTNYVSSSTTGWIDDRSIL